MITHLEKLVRTLPRQRRAFAAQASQGVGMLFTGLMTGSALVIIVADAPLSTSVGSFFIVLGLLCSAYLIAFGGYRYTKADILLHENAALIAAVNDAINQPRGEVELEIRFDAKQFKGDIERALDMALRDHRRGAR